MVGREVLSETQIDKALENLPGWSRDGEAIRREFEFSDFVAAVGFIAQVGVLAERANHHPELSNVYNKVNIALSSHDVGGVTERDLNLAQEINERA